MEVIAVAAAAVSISVLIAEISKLVQGLNRISDPRIKIIRSKLITEKRKFANWSIAMRITKIEDLKPLVEAQDYEIVVECFKDIKAFIATTSEKVSKLDQLETKGVKNISARVKWLYGEFDELKLLVDALTATIDALYMVAPVPPVYDRSVSMPMGAIEQQTHGQRHHMLASASDNEYEESAPVPENARARSELPDRVAYAADDIEQGSITAILNLYEQCKQALRTIKVHIPERGKEEIILARILSLFKLWGTDMFEGDTALDKVLNVNVVGEEEQDPIRAAVISVMVDITMIEEIILEFLSLSCEDKDRLRIQEMQLQVVAILGIPGVEGIAVQKSLPDFCAGEESSVLTETTNRLLLAIDDLFELLPAIRAARREYYLLKEEQEFKDSQSSPTTLPLAISSAPSALSDPPEDATVSEWVDWSVKSTTYLELQMYHKMKDKANASSTTDRVYYEKFRKHGEALKEWAESVKASKHGAMSADTEKEIKKVLMSYKQRLPITSGTPSLKNDGLLLDEKSLLKCTELIENTNEKLRNATAH